MARRSWKLNTLDLVELVELRDQVERAMRARIDQEQTNLRARLDQLAALQGGSGERSVATSSGARRGRPPRAGRAHALKGRKVAPKYRGPQGETWTGRGLAPRWL